MLSSKQSNFLHSDGKLWQQSGWRQIKVKASSKNSLPIEPVVLALGQKQLMEMFLFHAVGYLQLISVTGPEPFAAHLWLSEKPFTVRYTPENRLRNGTYIISLSLFYFVANKSRSSLTTYDRMVIITLLLLLDIFAFALFCLTFMRVCECACHCAEKGWMDWFSFLDLSYFCLPWSWGTSIPLEG